MIDLEYDIMETEWNVYGPSITSNFSWSWDYVKFIAIYWLSKLYQSREDG